MNFAIIAGSHRKESQSTKVAHACSHFLKSLVPNVTTNIIDLSRNPLPLWDESFWDKAPQWQTLWTPYSDILKKAEGIVVVSPEWAGMVPAGLKNFFLFCGNEELAHKPGLIVTVSSGMGGSYPVAELRMSSYKNNRLCYIPDHVIIRHVTNVLNNLEKPESTDDTRIQTRLKYSLETLVQYTKALKSVRESPHLNYKEFGNGM